MGKVKDGYSSCLNLNGFSGKSKSSTLGPNVLGLLFGRGKLIRCAGMGETSIGGGLGVGYGFSNFSNLSKSRFGIGACHHC